MVPVDPPLDVVPVPALAVLPGLEVLPGEPDVAPLDVEPPAKI